MDNESIDRLKFDRRLANRRGWLEAQELEQELASLPDATDKIHVASDEPEETEAPSAPAPAPAPPGFGPGPEGGTPGA